MFELSLLNVSLIFFHSFLFIAMKNDFQLKNQKNKTTFNNNRCLKPFGSLFRVCRKNFLQKLIEFLRLNLCYERTLTIIPMLKLARKFILKETGIGLLDFYFLRLSVEILCVRIVRTVWGLNTLHTRFSHSVFTHENKWNCNQQKINCLWQYAYSVVWPV